VNNLGDVLWAMIYFYFVFMIIWIFIRVFADIFTRQDLSGGWKVIWILGIFIIPFIGALVYILTRPKNLPQDQQMIAQAQVAAGYSVSDEVAKLAALRDSGAITPAEYDAQKAKLLG